MSAGNKEIYLLHKEQPGPIRFCIKSESRMQKKKKRGATVVIVLIISWLEMYANVKLDYKENRTQTHIQHFKI